MTWKLYDWLKLIFWAAAIAVGITLLICAPLIWQWLKHVPQATGDDKIFSYAIIGFLIFELFVISPIVDALKDIRKELREINNKFKP